MDIVIRAACVFLFVWLVLRALGKRQLGELTAFELVLLFVIGDLVQQSITQNDTSITAALLAISTIALLILTQSYVVFRFRRTRPVVEGSPVMVVHDGRMLHDVMHRERMAPDDVMEAARQQGIGDLAEVRCAILERDGKLAFIKNDSSGDQQSGGGHMIAT
jgi:uncharacterized membrane protein YcaP (DUF421 family)